jgi:hypothetical protein
LAESRSRVHPLVDRGQFRHRHRLSPTADSSRIHRTEVARICAQHLRYASLCNPDR